MGDEEELTPTQKLALAANFVLNSPPAQAPKVLEDVLALVGPSVLTPEKEAALLARTNKEKFACVAVDGRKVLLTPHGELPDGAFLDPSNGGAALTVDHKALTATVAAEPLAAEQLSSLAAAAPLREAVDAAMQGYCAEWLPQGVCTTYGTTGACTKVVCCTAALGHALANYWAGLFRSEWTLEVPLGGSMGQLTGKVFINVHYFEDGNVQLDDKAVFQTDVPASAAEVGAAFAEKVRDFEQTFLRKLEDIYQNMSKSVLQGLRRRLPITGQKFDWEKHAVAKLAGELQKQLIK